MPTNQARTDTVRRSRNKPMSDKQLTAFLGRKIYQAMNDEDGDLSDTRQDSFDRYLGDLYGNERDGYSKYTTREALETVEWVLPSILRVFLSGKKIVSFDPVSAEDEAAADQETDIVNHKLMKSNGGDGFLALHHFIKDALMFPNAYIKAYVDESEKVTTHHLCGIDALALMLVADDENNEITEQKSYFVNATNILDGMQQSAQQSMLQQNEAPLTPEGPEQSGLQQTESLQQPPLQQTESLQQPPLQQTESLQQPSLQQTESLQIELFDITYRKTVTERKLKIEPIPGEEALVDNDCVSLNIDTADFSCHRVRKSFTELIQMGFDRDKLESVGSYEDYQWNDERTNRLFYEDEDPDAEDEDDPSMRRFWVHDCYAWVDYNGDGIGEFRHITLIGTTVFVNEETDYQPMVAMSSILIPHKHNGMSLVDIVKDIQELQTTLTRQLLDNIYRINVRRKYISENSLIEDGTTLRSMLNTASEWIPVRGSASDAVMPEQTQSIVSEILPVIQHVNEHKANRTGVNPQVNLDPQVLQQTTEGAFMGALEQASQRVEMLVRIFAETGIKQLMRKVHQLVRTYPDIATAVKLRGEWIDVDPEGWQDRTDMTVNVGLGFNTKAEMGAMLVQLLQIQREAMDSGLVSERELYNTLEKLIESANLGDPQQYFKDPMAPGWQPPQPPPDPQAELASAQSQALLQEQQRKMQEMQIKGQTDQAKMQSDAQTDMQKLQLEQQVKERELALKERELALREQELLFNRQLEANKKRAETANIDADTDLKDEQALKTRIDGMVADKQLDESSSGAEDSGTDTV